MMMKVALLLFGQPRFVDHTNILDMYYYYIFNNYDTDVYAQCWFDPSGEYHESSSWALHHGAKHHVPSHALDYILTSYKPKKFLIQPPETFVVSPAVAEILDRRFTNNQYYSRTNMSNIISQANALDNVCRLVYDDRNSYDKFVLGRYDAVLENLPDLKTLDKHSFYKPRVGHFNDLVHVFSPNMLEKDTNPFYNLGSIIQNDSSLAGRIELPIPELFKYENFIHKNDPELLKSCDMYAHVIRN